MPRDPGKNKPARERIDLRADAALVARIRRQADRRQINMSAYVRQAVAAFLEKDEASDPGLTDR